MNIVKAFAPVNIALIKYMGKENGNPANASFSLTLDLGTLTQVKELDQGQGEIFFNASGYVPPEEGLQKVQRFLKHPGLWKVLLNMFDFEVVWPIHDVEISSVNSVPAGTGIATSASGYAALALAWSALLCGSRKNEWCERFKQDSNLRELLSAVAGKGSGSACRSINGPWVEWRSDGVHSFFGAKNTWSDIILLIDSEAKKVSSSEAHVRVRTSPLFVGRKTRSEERLRQVKSSLQAGNIKALQKQVLDEALDMHELFHTSEPSFSYLKPLSREWIALVQDGSPLLPSQNAVLTLDAGANVHLLLPTGELPQWENWIKEKYPALTYVIANQGTGAFYEL